MINLSSVFFTLILVCIFIRHNKYFFNHYCGTLISVVGIGLTLYGYLKLDHTDLNSHLEGILYCLLAALLNSISAVLQEINLYSGEEIYEFLAWNGLIGSFITAGEIYFFEWDRLKDITFTPLIITLISTASACLLCFSIIVPFYIKRCSAAMFNISQVSQIFWSSLINLLVFKEEGSDLYFYVGFLLVITGIFIYHQYPIKKADRIEKKVNEVEKREVVSENVEVLSSNSKLVTHSYNNNRMTFYKENLSTKSINLLLNNPKVKPGSI